MLSEEMGEEDPSAEPPSDVDLVGFSAHMRGLRAGRDPYRLRY